MPTTPKQLLALDIGEKRIGTALTSNLARLPRPFLTLKNSEHIFNDLLNLVQSENVMAVVIGLPRGLEGQETAQTRTVIAFVKRLKAVLTVPLYWQDEAVTSINARLELKNRRKKSTIEDIDALAATYILEDFLNNKSRGPEHG